MGEHSYTYDLDAQSDLDAWRTEPIRSHKRPTYSLRRPMLAVLVLTAAASLLTTSALPDAQPPHASPTIVAEALPAVPPVADTPVIVADDRAALRAGRDQARRVAPPLAPQPSKIEIVIAYALAQVGDRYTWGAAGPNAFDCSGLVLMAFKQIGISLPHFTGTMLSRGTRVSKAAMQRGDIVFPSSGHVAIYLGNGQMVAASSGAGKVRVQSVYGFYAARRLV